jgi:hypothetical protein
VTGDQPISTRLGASFIRIGFLILMYFIKDMRAQDLHLDGRILIVADARCISVDLPQLSLSIIAKHALSDLMVV